MIHHVKGRNSVLAAAFAMALAAAVVDPSSASTETAEAQSGKPTGILPIFAFESTSCASYPVHDVKITVQPAHGAARLVEQATPVDKVYSHCKARSSG